MLDDDVIPVANPECTVWSNFGTNRGRPSISGVVDIVWKLVRAESGTLGLDSKLPDKFTGGTADEGDFIPVAFGKTTPCVNCMAGGGGVCVMVLNLTDISRRRIKGILKIGARSAGLREVKLLINLTRKGDVCRRVSIRGRGEDVEFLGETEAPSVVASALNVIEFYQMLQGAILASFCFCGISQKAETKDSLGKFFFAISNHATEARVTDSSVYPAVRPAAQVGRAGVRITHVKSFEEWNAEISLVISIGIFKEKKFSAVGDDHAIVVEDDRSGDGKLFGKSSELIGFAIVICVLADCEPVISSVASLDVVGVINSFENEGATAGIELDGDGVHDVGFTGKE